MTQITDTEEDSASEWENNWQSSRGSSHNSAMLDDALPLDEMVEIKKEKQTQEEEEEEQMSVEDEEEEEGSIDLEILKKTMSQTGNLKGLCE